MSIFFIKLILLFIWISVLGGISSILNYRIRNIISEKNLNPPSTIPLATLLNLSRYKALFLEEKLQGLLSNDELKSYLAKVTNLFILSWVTGSGLILIFISMATKFGE